jgi:hypothetical protein
MSTTQASNEMAAYLLFSNVGIILCSAILLISILMLTLQPVLAPFMFLLSIMAPIILGIIIQSIVSTTDTLDNNGNLVKSSESGLSSWLHSFYTGEEYQWLNRIEGVAFGCIEGAWWLGKSISAGFIPIGLIVSIIGVVIALGQYMLNADDLLIATALTGIFVGSGLLTSTMEFKDAGKSALPFYRVAWSISAVSFTYYCFDLVV